MSSFECKIVSSLEKVFCRQELTATELHRLSGAGGEVIAFQVACKSHDGTWVDIEVDSPLSEYITIREIGLVPCELDYRITMTRYPIESSWLLELRNKVNKSLR